MDDNKILQQISSIFSIFMIVFYIGAGIFLIFFFEKSIIDKETRTIIGSAFLIYGTFRTFKSVFQIKRLFFDKEETDNEQ